MHALSQAWHELRCDWASSLLILLALALVGALSMGVYAYRGVAMPDHPPGTNATLHWLTLRSLNIAPDATNSERVGMRAVRVMQAALPTATVLRTTGAFPFPVRARQGALRLNVELLNRDALLQLGVHSVLGTVSTLHRDACYLTEHAWRRYFGAVRDILGQSLRIEHRTCLVRAVLAAPFHGLMSVAYTADVIGGPDLVPGILEPAQASTDAGQRGLWWVFAALPVNTRLAQRLALAARAQQALQQRLRAPFARVQQGYVLAPAQDRLREQTLRAYAAVILALALVLVLMQVLSRAARWMHYRRSFDLRRLLGASALDLALPGALGMGLLMLAALPFAVLGFVLARRLLALDPLLALPAGQSVPMNADALLLGFAAILITAVVLLAFDLMRLRRMLWRLDHARAAQGCRAGCLWRQRLGELAVLLLSLALLTVALAQLWKLQQLASTSYGMTLDMTAVVWPQIPDGFFFSSYLADRSSLQAYADHLQAGLPRAHVGVAVSAPGVPWIDTLDIARIAEMPCIAQVLLVQGSPGLIAALGAHVLAGSVPRRRIDLTLDRDTLRRCGIPDRRALGAMLYTRQDIPYRITAITSTLDYGMGAASGSGTSFAALPEQYLIPVLVARGIPLAQLRQSFLDYFQHLHPQFQAVGLQTLRQIANHNTRDARLLARGLTLLSGLLLVFVLYAYWALSIQHGLMQLRGQALRYALGASPGRLLRDDVRLRLGLIVLCAVLSPIVLVLLAPLGLQALLPTRLLPPLLAAACVLAGISLGMTLMQARRLLRARNLLRAIASI